MSNDHHPLFPEAKIISLTRVDNPSGLQQLSIQMVYRVVEDPPNVTPGELHLASQPSFYTDEDGNFLFKITLSNGKINNSLASDKGTAVLHTLPDSGDNAEIYYACTWEGNSAMPPSDQIFMIKVVLPAAESGGTKKQLKWGFKRDGK